MPRKLRVLDFDVECLPGHWIGGDYVSKIITAAAWKWIGERESVQVRTHYDSDPVGIADEMACMINEADIVAGHWIRSFDLRLINGNLLRGGFEPLEPVMSHDTKSDLYSTHGRSLSQKNLAAQIGVSKPKVDVTLFEWEAFNTKTPGFRQKGEERVRGDVLQNIEMRDKLLTLGWLGPPRRWDSTKTGGRYHA